MTPKSLSLLEIHLAVLLFGLAGLFGKLINLPAQVIVFGRVFFASLILGLLLIFSKQTFKLKKQKDYLVLIVLGILLAIHWTTFFQSIKVSTVAIGLLSYSTFPIFTTFIEPWVFKEKLKNKDLLLAIITIIGITLIIPKFTLSNHITQGVLWGTLSGLSFSLLSILNRKSVKEYSSLVISFYQDSIATIVLLPFLFYTKTITTTQDIFLLMLLGVVFTALAHTIFIKGLAHIKAQTASIIANLEAVYGIVFAFLFLSEIPGLRTLFGGLLIIGTTFLATKDSSN